jgi:hypothetical protein
MNIGEGRRNDERVYPDLTSHTLTTLSHPPLTTRAFGWPHPSEAKHGSLCRSGTYIGVAGLGAILVVLRWIIGKQRCE